MFQEGYHVQGAEGCRSGTLLLLEVSLTAMPCHVAQHPDMPNWPQSSGHCFTPACICITLETLADLHLLQMFSLEWLQVRTGHGRHNLWHFQIIRLSHDVHSSAMPARCFATTYAALRLCKARIYREDLSAPIVLFFKSVTELPFVIAPCYMHMRRAGEVARNHYDLPTLPAMAHSTCGDTQAVASFCKQHGELSHSQWCCSNTCMHKSNVTQN